jgi:hypothetical protein
MLDISLRLGACVAVLALSAACTTAPTDATWVGTDHIKAEFSDPTNWSPAVVPTGIASIPPSGQPPRSLEPQVRVSGPITLAAIRQTGGLIYSGAELPGQITLTGAGWSVCGKTSATSIIGTVKGNISMCPGPAVDFGYGQIGTLIGDVTVLGGGFGANLVHPGPSDLTVTGSVVVDQTGALVAWVPERDQAILDVQGSITIKGNATTLGVSPDFNQTVRTATAIAIRAKGGITGRFASVIIINSPYYKADVVYRPTEIQVTVTRIGGPRRGQAPAPPQYTWPPGGLLPVKR